MLGLLHDSRRSGHRNGHRAASLLLLAALLCIPALVPEGAAARACGFQALKLEFPRYGRAGKPIRIPVTDYSKGRDAYPGTIEVLPSGPQPSRTYPLELRNMQAKQFGHEGTVVLPALKRNQATFIRAIWIEGKGGPIECYGTAEATIPIVPPRGKAGIPEIPRIEGRFKVVSRVVRSGVPGFKGTARPIWRFWPHCRYFGCSARMRSSLGLRGHFETWYPPGGIYDYQHDGRSGRLASCEGDIVNPFTGEVIRHIEIKRAYRELLKIRLSVEADPKTKRAKSFTGWIVRHFEPIPRAKRRGCPDKYVTESIRGRHIQHRRQTADSGKRMKRQIRFALGGDP